MEKRKYTKVEAFEAEMIAMREAGKTRQEIADYLGLEKGQIKNWINRYNRKQRKEAAGIMLRPKGRPRKDALNLNISYSQALFCAVRTIWGGAKPWDFFLCPSKISFCLRQNKDRP